MILVITGASGAGKTSVTRALEALHLRGVGCHYFDSVGVPSSDEMTADFGSPEGWQRATLIGWVRRLASDEAPVDLHVLEGQVRPAEVLEAFADQGVDQGHLLLLDCSPEVRATRLRQGRGQPELATEQMTAWAAYLRGQADALRVPVLDTTSLSIEEAADQIRERVIGLIAGAT
jgi:thymidylate kinase